jgi:hypothetical protein
VRFAAGDHNIKAQLAKSTQQQTLPANAPAADTSVAPRPGQHTTVGGYGEFTYNNSRNTDATITRRIGGASSCFLVTLNDNLRFYSELEFEHAVVSSGDRGEAVRAGFIDYRFNDAQRRRAGCLTRSAYQRNARAADLPWRGTYFVETRIRAPGAKVAQLHGESRRD